MIATLDQIHRAKELALNLLAEDDDAAERLARIHPELCTPLLFRALQDDFQRQLRKNRATLEALMQLCDCLLAERGEA